MKYIMGIFHNFNGISLMNRQDIMACNGISWRYFIDRFRGDSGMTNKFSGMWGINTTDSNDIMGMVNVSRWARGLGLCVNSPFGHDFAYEDSQLRRMHFS
jgi:hypothetical protein